MRVLVAVLAVTRRRQAAATNTTTAAHARNGIDDSNEPALTVAPMILFAQARATSGEHR